jgi:hypothetical protein
LPSASAWIVRTVGAFTGPVRDLEADEHTENDDQQFDPDRRLFLPLQMMRDTAKDH